MAINPSGVSMRASPVLRLRALATPLASGSARNRRCCTLPLRAASEAAVAQPPPPSNGNGNGNGYLHGASAPAAESVALPPAVDAPPAPATAAPATAASATAAPVNENFAGDMLQPSIVNTPLVRAASVLVAVAAVACSTVVLPTAVGAFLHMTSYAVLLGTQLWNTFFVGLTMFKNMPRQMFGKVQSKLFPMYFALTAGANLLAMITLALAGAATTPAGVRALVALGVSLVGLVANWLYIEPICTTLMFQRYDIENLPEKTDADKERIAALYKQFGKWHGISSLVNLVSFCVAVSHGWFLASLLVIV